MTSQDKAWQTEDLDLLKNSTLFNSLDNRQISELAEQFKPASFQRGEIIFTRGGPGDALYLIKSGRVKVSITNQDGNELIITIYSRGEIFGEMSLFDGLPRSADATALEAVEALQLSRANFEELLLKLPQLSSSIIAMLSRRLRYTTTELEMIGLLDAYERVAYKLLQLAESGEQTGTITIKLSQQELASMLGLTRVWLNKVLNYFVEQGVIQVDRGKITLLDIQALRKWL
ncbi:MAG TPA: Crp/Fnr family transcriptional regulator [Chloroflexia bacterium]|nr:Crp/Fnr family transcriptional regulator [Chloroflexia bacterium]